MATTYDYARLSEEFGSTAERLAFIDFKLRFTGEIQRADLANAFGISEASSTRLLSSYHQLRQDNMKYDRSKKVNVICDESYQPIVDMDADTALGMLAHGFNKNRLIGKPILKYSRVGRVPEQLDVSEVATITRTMFNGKTMTCDYISASSTNHKARDLVPLTLISDGKNWLFRAYDRSEDKKYKFKNFNYSRVCNIRTINGDDGNSQVYETLEHDSKWNVMVPISLELHPKLSKNLRESVRHDYGMDNNQNEIYLTERGALVWLLCNQWLVDKGQSNYENQQENGSNIQFHFILKNRDMLLDYL